MQSQGNSRSVAILLYKARRLKNISHVKIANARLMCRKKRRSFCLRKKVLLKSVLRETVKEIEELKSERTSWKLSHLNRPTTVSKRETEEAVLAIMPKKSRSQLDNPSSTMETVRNTSLVPIPNLDAAPTAASSGNLISLKEAEGSSSEKENSLDSRVREIGQPTNSVQYEIRQTNSGETQNSGSDWETEQAVQSILLN
ncbi:Hypothetical predicted protein [Cloeon dipterum]|uniref:Uncharacterized protein n=1 Tax=Cloeon dipterum TaxID=197152 RepID=A0A8S1DPE4_9INSE|nr:Hypothetical predicted protein [Cloeon dipterum]